MGPLALLLIYGFVFVLVFKGRFGATASESTFDYALAIFLGLSLIQIVIDSLSAAPTIIVQQPNYVKKVVFPLEMLPLASVFGSAVRCFIALMLICPPVFYFQGGHCVQLWLLLIYINFIMIGAGIAWAVSAFGVYIRDISPFVQLVATLIMFCSAVFYSPEKIPPAFAFLKLNPVLIGLDLARNVFLWNRVPNYFDLAVFSSASIFVFGAGYWVFTSLRGGFADAL